MDKLNAGGTDDDNNVNTEQDSEDATERGSCLDEASTKRRGAFVYRLCSDKNLRHKLLHTACVCLSMIALGWRLSMTGPTLPDLRLILNENLSRASWIISALALGGLVGSLVSGALYDRLNEYVVFVGLTLILAMSSVATPWCSSFGSMVAIHVVVGMCGGGLDTIIVADVVRLWRQRNAPYMQAVNFAFSIGAMFSPLSVEPFLAKRHHILQTETNLTNRSGTYDKSFNTTYTHIQEFDEEEYDNTTDASLSVNTWICGETNVHYAFIISGAICLIASISFVVQYCCLGHVHKIPTQIKSNGYSKKSVTEQFPLSRNWRIALLILLSLMLSAYIISERAMYSFLMTFLVERLGWDKAAGSKATTVFWTVFMIGRLLSITIVKIIRLRLVFILFFGILLLGEMLMLISVRSDLPALTWVSCGLIGLGMSTLYAGIVSWLATKVCPLTGKVSSVVFTITASGAFVFPLITGNVMSDVSYDWFIYLEIILTCFMIVLFTFAELTYKMLT